MMFGISGPGNRHTGRIRYENYHATNTALAGSCGVPPQQGDDEILREEDIEAYLSGVAFVASLVDEDAAEEQEFSDVVREMAGGYFVPGEGIAAVFRTPLEWQDRINSIADLDGWLERKAARSLHTRGGMNAARAAAWGARIVGLTNLVGLGVEIYVLWRDVMRVVVRAQDGTHDRYRFWGGLYQLTSWILSEDSILTIDKQPDHPAVFEPPIREGYTLSDRFTVGPYSGTVEDARDGWRNGAAASRTHVIEKLRDRERTTHQRIETALCRLRRNQGVDLDMDDVIGNAELFEVVEVMQKMALCASVEKEADSVDGQTTVRVLGRRLRPAGGGITEEMVSMLPYPPG